MSNNIAVAIKKCNSRCHKIQGYVGLKRIKFATEMDYKKCKVCECHFLYHSNIIYCQCCHFKLRSKTPRRNMETKIKALKFKESMTESYTPSATALWQRKYRINLTTPNKCQNQICIDQRNVSTVPRELKYKLYYVCVTCKTNWPQTLLRCPCCGLMLRKSPRKKTPYNKRDYD